MNPSFIKFVKSLQVVHWVIMGGIVLFGVFGYFNISRDSFDSTSGLVHYIRLISAVLLLIVWLVVRFILSKRVQSFRELPMQDKMQRVRQVHVMKLALLELPALIALVGFLFTGDILCMLYAAMAVFVIATEFPTMNKVADWLSRDESEKQSLVG